MNKIKAGLMAVGLDTYWQQFDGLLDRLLAYNTEIKERMQAMSDVEITDAGMVDNVDKAWQAVDMMKGADIDILFIFVSTYALSSTIVPVATQLHVPVVMLNMQPTPAIDYDSLNSLGDRGAMTGEWLANCQACSIPEFCAVFNRAATRYDIISGFLADNEAWTEIGQWLKAAAVARGMSHNRMGLLGNYYGGMVDVYSDLRLQSTTFGTHMEILEMSELAALRREVTDADIKAKKDEFAQIFEIDKSCTPSEIERAARTSVALDRLVSNHRLGSMAYYYSGSGDSEYENIVTSLIAGNTILTGKGIPVAGEYEVKNVQAMKIMSLLGAGGCFSEFYAVDYADDIVMLGHDGPAHFLLAQDKTRLVPLPVYHGKPGKGLSIQMSVKHGPVTLLSVVEGKDGISLLVAEGESVEGPVLNIGNINSRYRFNISAKEFIKRWSMAGPSHHCAIGSGHIASIIRKYAFILGINVITV
ncbi:MAG: L-fucose/L-arabinose isomerase family protein [Muribaculaceae bacterium]|nr:L-fucose/L-arabinose isomerase family protein [Muribaculaceae bacterium]